MIFFFWKTGILEFPKITLCKRFTKTHRHIVMVKLIDITFNKGLKCHISSVHEKISYLCKICNISFSQSQHLKRHMHEIHERESPFKCLICGSNFRRNSDLKKHVLKKHIFSSSSQSLHEFVNLCYVLWRITDQISVRTITGLCSFHLKLAT